MHYDMVYMSPERTLYSEGHFWKLLGKSGQGWTDNVSYVVIDKAHIMEEWGWEFRPEYGNLSKLRPYLPNVAFVLTTATANANQLARLREFVCIRPDSITVHETINRKKLFYGVKVIRGRGDGHQDLDFVVPKTTDQREYNKIKPTIIYCDTYEDCRGVAKYLRRRMIRNMRKRPKILDRSPTSDVRVPAEVLISVYYRNLSDTLKGYIETDWRAGKTRVLVATAA